MTQYVISFAIPDAGNTPHNLGYSCVGHAKIANTVKAAEKYIRKPPARIRKLLKPGVFVIATEESEYGRIVAAGVTRLDNWFAVLSDGPYWGDTEINRISEIGFLKGINTRIASAYYSGNRLIETGLIKVDWRTLLRVTADILFEKMQPMSSAPSDAIDEFIRGSEDYGKLQSEMANAKYMDRSGALYTATDYLSLLARAKTSKSMAVCLGGILSYSDERAEIISRIHQADVLFPLLLDDVKLF